MVQLSEYDVLHDEGLAYANRLKEEGVPVEVVDHAGMLHGFIRQAGIFDRPPPRGCCVTADPRIGQAGCQRMVRRSRLEAADQAAVPRHDVRPGARLRWHAERIADRQPVQRPKRTRLY